MCAPETSIALSKSHMLAADGRCKTFDAAADGFSRGEGCGMVVLKRLSEAKRDGDRMLAVVRGSAINQDGRSSGLTVPNGPAQESVIRERARGWLVSMARTLIMSKRTVPAPRSATRSKSGRSAGFWARGAIQTGRC